MHAEHQEMSERARGRAPRPTAVAQPTQSTHRPPAADAMLALQRTAGNSAVTRAVRGATVQRAPDWKNNTTKNALKTYKASHAGDPMVDTLHHIIPKSLLGEFALNLSAADAAFVATALGIGGTTPSGLAKGLKNFPANFLIGPRPEQRTSDPGDALDLNRDATGATTPRSAVLQPVNTWLQLQQLGGWPTVSQADLTSNFITPMQAAAGLHGPGVNIDSARTQWSLSSSGTYDRP